MPEVVFEGIVREKSYLASVKGHFEIFDRVPAREGVWAVGKLLGRAVLRPSAIPSVRSADFPQMQSKSAILHSRSRLLSMSSVH